MSAATVLQFPARPAPKKPRAKRAARPANVVMLPVRPVWRDQENVLEVLTNIRSRAIRGEFTGAMLVMRDTAGEYSCIRAGCIDGMQKEAIVPGIIGILKLCDAN
ncbi:hypothetical protein [Pseudorhodoferax soli]|uniref:Uncharacterized protein n=1 Tax=Pseudorhodoferax soli TaxID=545864 RepID=A0A368XBU6_9BURK|nr:hypothetical protein [Pseudorhodoferax soli]RCW65189.1 hypothetical protein DES41_113113 [Pseudorhodoferax soli]